MDPTLTYLELWHVQYTLGALICGAGVAAYRQHRHTQTMSNAHLFPDALDGEHLKTEGAEIDSPTCHHRPATFEEFLRFQRSYLAVYLLCTFSDWLKGPYVYALYEAYGFSQLQIAWLFVGGFLSSLVFGTFVGSLSDKYGRKRMCLVFCLVYALSAFTKMVNSFVVLFLGRVLSGVATSLLFTSFESWMVSEHRARGFPEQLISNTFSKAILGNGIVAVAAGFVAQAAANCCGYVAPFMCAVPCLALSSWLILKWPENYGNQSAKVYETLLRGWEAIVRERKLQYLGACQSLFEGAMYVWVFYWTPCLSHPDGSPVPFGLVFACYMSALMIGGALCDLVAIENLVFPLHSFSILSVAAAALMYHNKYIVFLCFVLFEGLVGVYFGVHGTIRSMHIEETTRSSVMNIFRVPLNSFVVGTLQVPMASRNVMLLLTVVHTLSLGFLKLFVDEVQEREKTREK